MSKSRSTDTLALFAPGVFRCRLCNDLAVDEPGELCTSCASVVLTKPKPTRRPRARRAAAGSNRGRS